MGISDLNKVIDTHAPAARTWLPLELFQGQRIAIDATNLIHITWATSNKQVVNSTDVGSVDVDRVQIERVWLTQLRTFINRFIKFRITPVFVFDGVHPVEKSETQLKRQEDKIKTHREVLDLKGKLETQDLLERDSTLVERLRVLLRRDTFITGDETGIFRAVLEAIGIPVIQAPGEGEHECARLYYQGLVSAVYSTDTDLLALGCRVVITGFSRGRESSVDVTLLDRALVGLEMDFSQFRELCILLGCDYNKRIRGVGPVRALKFLKKYKTIDQFPKEVETGCLRVEICQERFRVGPSDYPETQVKIRTQSLSTCREVLEMFHLEDWIQSLVPIYSNWPTSNPVPLKIPT